MKKLIMTSCDMCGSEIKEGECSCGTWKTGEETKDHPMKKAIEQFHEMKRFTLTCDTPCLGCAAVFFRGDYNDTKKVEEFIRTMKGRPYYREET